MNSIANNIKNRLSLRKPQAESLEILSEIADILEMKKNTNLEDAKAKIKQLGEKHSEVKKFAEFERDFPNICFALATGVGKTRLMGAFIAYLHIAKGINNFFVLAPNLTIYNKLQEDFGNPAHPKYVFKGIAEFAISQPQVITGDNYNKIQNIGTQQTAFNRVRINVFNISKINAEARGGKEPLMKRLSEYLGESYFEHLVNLPDLVLLMDESHHYRADAGLRVLNELNPVLGLEVTATPQIENSNKTTKFKNVVYEYSLAKAMKDGFVKEPAVATRKNFDPDKYKTTPEELDQIKLADGVKIHEDTKLELYKYSLDNKVKLVKPFVLVVAKDTTHAEWLEKLIKSEEFFKGYYKDKVMQIHSQQKGSEKDENIQRLVKLEDPNNQIEIVIHVNMLKEGWDVTNLYTIIPLRTATSTTLREQTIGRGLRLPYGQRTGDPKVDKLTIVAHDKFQEILEAARKEDSIIKQENIIEIDEIELSMPKQVITTISKLEEQAKEEQQQIDSIVDSTQKAKAQLQFSAKEDMKQAIFELGKQGLNLSQMTDSKIKETAKKQAVQRIKSKEQLGLFDSSKVEEYEKAIDELDAKEEKEKIQRLIIEIPKILIIPAETKAWFSDFDLDTNFLSIRPYSEEIIRKTLREGDSDTISGVSQFVSDKLENIIVNELVNIPEVNYNDCAKLLFKLAIQALDKFKTYLSDQEVKSVVQYRKKDIADFIRPQLMEHFQKEVTRFEAPDVRAFSQILEHNSYKYLQDEIYDFKETIEPVSRIKTLLFTGFKKACHTCYKFDSKTEKDFAIILEEDDIVEKWLRPAPNQFNITWDNNKKNYEPDFVVETIDAIYLIETKKAVDVATSEVQEKAKAALVYCKNATACTTKNDGKPWKYILLPHDIVKSNMGFDYLMQEYEYNDISKLLS